MPPVGRNIAECVELVAPSAASKTTPVPETVQLVTVLLVE
jgi:hypothetical protein